MVYHTKMSWEPLYGQEKQPTKLNSLLNTVMHKLAGTSTQVIDEIFSNWDEIIGVKLGKYTRPTHLKDNCLHIQADDPVIAKELEWRSKKIIEKANLLIPKALIERTKITSKKEK